jgi:hypothetical protein
MTIERETRDRHFQGSRTIMALKRIFSKWISQVESQAEVLRAKLNQTKDGSRRPALILKRLEERVMMSATPIPVDVPNDTATKADPSSEGAQDSVSSPGELSNSGNDTAPSREVSTSSLMTPWASPSHPRDSSVSDQMSQTDRNEVRRELVFIDKAAQDYEQLVSNLLASTDQVRQFDVYLIDSDSDGIAQITEVLADYDEIDAIHIVSHSDDGEIRLGNVSLHSQNLAGYAAELTSWRDALASDADLLFYGCDLAQSGTGQSFVDAIGALCDCDVAASSDATGLAALGGDWNLDYNLGQVETTIAFNAQLQNTWQHLLAGEPGWELLGSTSVSEGSSASYTIKHNGRVTWGTNVQVDVTLTDTSTTAADRGAITAALDAALVGRPNLTRSGNRLTFAVPNNYNATGGGFSSIAATGTAVTLGDDTTVAASLGFTFSFYENNYTSLFISSNGILTFGTADNAHANAVIVSGTALGGKAAILPFWDDLNPASGGTIHHQTTGTAGSRTFVVQYTNVPPYNNGTDGGTFQVRLSESNGQISFHYNDVDFTGTGNDGGVSATIGIQSGTGKAVQHSFNTSSVVAGSSLTFVAPTDRLVPLTFTLPANSDSNIEVNETYRVNLSNPSANTAVGPDNQIITTIANTTMSTVTVTATDASAAEATTDGGTFTVDLGAVNQTGSSITVNYTISGTATGGTDYTSLSGSVAVASGSQTATISVAGIVDDSRIEANETVIVALTSTSNANLSVNSTPATLTITDNDTAQISVSVIDGLVNEPDNNGTIRFTQSTISDFDTIVTISTSGTAAAGSDFIGLATSITIVAGATTFDLPVTVIDNSIIEAGETLIVTAVSTNDARVTIAAGSNVGSIAINDNDTGVVSISVSDASASESNNHGQFTVTLAGVSDRNTLVNYSVSGTATDGTDYTALTGSVTILAGNTSAVIDVNVIDNSVLESSESVSITLTNTNDPAITVDSTNANANLTIADNDTAVVSVAVSDSSAGEPANGGAFTISITNPSDSDTIINYSISGTAASGVDYTALPGTITILAGSTSAIVNVSVIDNLILEDDEAVILTITGVTGANSAAVSVSGSQNSATLTLTDDDTAQVSVAATDSTASEPGNNGQYTISMSRSSDKNTLVNFTMTGTASGGSDYTTISGSVTILAGQTTAVVNVNVLDDSILENNETVILTLTWTDDTDVTVNTSANVSTITLTDDDTATVNISVSDSTANEPGNDGQFTVSMSQVSDQDTVVNFTITGTSGNGVDYTTMGSSVTILAGQTSALIDIDLINDSIIENDETVILTLTGTNDPDVTLGSTTSATLTIVDEDVATVAVSVSDSSAGESSNHGQFTITQSTVIDRNTVVNFTITGTATSGSDYTTIAGSVTILAG